VGALKGTPEGSGASWLVRTSSIIDEKLFVVINGRCAAGALREGR